MFSPCCPDPIYVIPLLGHYPPGESRHKRKFSTALMFIRHRPLNSRHSILRRAVGEAMEDDVAPNFVKSKPHQDVSATCHSPSASQKGKMHSGERTSSG
jgi:hypothetical protein